MMKEIKGRRNKLHWKKVLYNLLIVSATNASNVYIEIETVMYVPDQQFNLNLGGIRLDEAIPINRHGGPKRTLLEEVKEGKTQVFFAHKGTRQEVKKMMQFGPAALPHVPAQSVRVVMAGVRVPMNPFENRNFIQHSKDFLNHWIHGHF